MNDFTKKELNLLLGSLNSNIRMYIEPDNIYELRDKIQSMIDDYSEHECNHKSDGLMYKEFGTRYQSDNLPRAWMCCTKCGEFYE